MMAYTDEPPAEERKVVEAQSEVSDKVPVTGALLSLISALQASRKTFINESSMADELGLPTPVDWHARCENLFFKTYKEHVSKIGLRLNQQTFEAILRTTITEDVSSTLFDDLPKKFLFDPWAGMGYGGIVPSTPPQVKKPRNGTSLGM